MKKVIIKNMTKNNIMLAKAEVAASFFTRLKGLLGRKQLEKDSGLVITHCNSIHMIGMRFSIDAVFIDKDKQVCHIIPSMKVMQISPIVKNAKYVIEAPEGTVKSKNIEVKDRIEMINI